MVTYGEPTILLENLTRDCKRFARVRRVSFASPAAHLKAAQWAVRHAN
jgi:hypothetical protein